MKKIRFSKQEWIALGLCLAAVAAACVVLLLAPPGSPHAKWLPKCMFHQLTGLYCPGCGATRALSALLHGDIRSSLHNNLLLIPGGITVAIMVVKPGVSLKRPVAVTVAAAIIGFTVLRNIPAEPFTYLAPIPLQQPQPDSEELEPGSDDRGNPDQHEHGGQQEEPEPAERQGALG